MWIKVRCNICGKLISGDCAVWVNGSTDDWVPMKQCWNCYIDQHGIVDDYDENKVCAD